MRVLAIKKDDIGKSVMEINEIGYDEDLLGVKDEDGRYDRFKDKLTKGLYFDLYDDTSCYIKDVSESEANNILSDILSNGFVDLTTYGEYEEYKNNEAANNK